ncbi:hypothetical protein [Rhizobium sp. CAU 1783]
MKSETEQERLADLAKIEVSELPKFAPGSFGCHEVLHVSSLLVEDVARHLLAHPSIVIDPEFYELAREAHDRLFALYQAIGRKHLGAD